MELPPCDASMYCMMRTCSKCRQPKPATTEYFHVSKKRSCGLRTECIECRTQRSTRSLTWRTDLSVRERLKQARERRLTTLHGFISDVVWNYFRQWQRRIYACETDLTVDYLEKMWHAQHGRCYWLGIPMLFGRQAPTRHPQKASLDRLDGRIGYMQGNVVWASNFANRGRGELDSKAFHKFLIQFGILSPPLCSPSPKGNLVPR